MSTSNTLLHDLADVTIRSVSVSTMDNNAYLVTHKQTGAQVLIDAADDAPALRRLLASAADDVPGEPKLALIATTHQHWDHIRALKELSEETGTRTAAGAADADAIREQVGVDVEVTLEHGDVGNFEGFDLTAIHLRGHTPGSTAYVYQDPQGPAHVFTGDSLFPGGVGNTDQDPARFTSLYDDVVARLFEVFPDDTIIHPGHGQGTTLGAERPHLAEWKARGW